jgi:hypothetical protein
LIISVLNKDLVLVAIREKGNSQLKKIGDLDIVFAITRKTLYCESQDKSDVIGVLQ